MSIFGFKKNAREQNNLNQNNLISRINDLHRRILPLTDLSDRVEQTKEKVDILGVKNNENKVLVNGLNTKILSLENKNNDDIYNKILPVINNLTEKVETINPIITITAESKGPLIKNEVFSFGNAGRERSVGYVVMRRGYITGISLSSERSSGEVRVGVLIDRWVLEGCEITLNTTPRKHDNFDNDKKFLVNLGSVINFISLGSNETAVNTVASLLFEIKNYP
jgi:hypothetical protein